MNRSYLVFLDIDGVFTSSRIHLAHNAVYEMWHRFDPVAIDFMNKLHDKFPVEFVLISTWKEELKVDHKTTEHWVKATFANSGFRGVFSDIWKTDPHNLHSTKTFQYNRAHEIRDYLAEYGSDIEDYIIFDDNDYAFEKVLGKKRLIRTDSENGLLFKHMKNAMSIVGTWNKK